MSQLKPNDFRINLRGVGVADEIVGTLGKAELEFAATLVIHYHHVMGLSEWVPVSRAMIVTELMEKPEVNFAKWAQNPFWKPDAHGLAAGGYITGWNEGSHALGSFTEKFWNAIDAVAVEKRKRMERELQRAQEPSSHRYVLVHPEMGIYLGNGLGLGFWSKLDPVGQDAAITFATAAEAHAHAATWENKISELLAVAVDGDIIHQGQATYASIESCQSAGLEGWRP